jgi:hypothetical protein
MYHGGTMTETNNKRDFSFGAGIKFLAAIALTAILSLFISCGGGGSTVTPTGTGTSTGGALSGTWNFTFSNIPYVGSYGPVSGEVTQNGSTIQVTFPSLGTDVYSGTVSGSTVTFTGVDISGVIVDMTGTVTDSTHMAGTWSSPPYSGTWSAIKMP